jgi:hypothetical protein
MKSFEDENAKDLEIQSQTITIEAESDWHHSQSDATSECDDRLDSLERSAISDAESRGLEYVQGSTSGYNIEYNSSTDMYKCSCQRTLEFVDPNDPNIRIDSEPNILSEEEIQNIIDSGEYKSIPNDPPVAYNC